MELIEWLSSHLSVFGDYIFEIILAFVGNINNYLTTTIINFLPDDPFAILIDKFSNSSLAEYMPYINYFIPFDYFFYITQIWLVAIFGFYAVIILLRCLKVIS